MHFIDKSQELKIVERTISVDKMNEKIKRKIEVFSNKAHRESLSKTFGTIRPLISSLRPLSSDEFDLPVDEEEEDEETSVESQ